MTSFDALRSSSRGPEHCAILLGSRTFVSVGGTPAREVGQFCLRRVEGEAQQLALFAQTRVSFGLGLSMKLVDNFTGNHRLR